MKILIYPPNRNPYQNLLYSSLQGLSPESSFLYINNSRSNLLLFPLIVLFRRLQGYKIFHLHWVAFNIRMPIPYSKRISYLYSKFCIGFLKLLGYKIVWTVHNLLPHEESTSDDIQLMRYIAQTVDMKIVHSPYNLQQMREAGLSDVGAVVIPHGSYDSQYVVRVTRQKAREKLNIKSSEFVILFFGAIRPYKGLGDLLEVFPKLKSGSRKPRLVVAGECLDESLKQKLLEAGRNMALDFYDGYVAENEVATYFRAADIVCLPFKSVTTSGSSILALSFGLPIVAPRVGALRDLPEGLGYFYAPPTDSELRKTLELVLSPSGEASLRRRAANARKYASELSWDKIAEQTFAVYKALT